MTDTNNTERTAAAEQSAEEQDLSWITEVCDGNCRTCEHISDMLCPMGGCCAHC